MKYKKNLRVEGDKVFSYNTHVATISGEELISHGSWSKTTSRHINHVAHELGLVVVDKKEIKNYIEEGSFLDAMKAFMALGELTSNGNSREEKQAYQERIVFATMKSQIPEWQKPEGWDKLPIEERERRIKKLKTI
jgi:hypothetical protein